MKAPGRDDGRRHGRLIAAPIRRVERHVRRSSSGSLAMLAAMRRVSLLSRFRRLPLIV